MSDFVIIGDTMKYKDCLIYVCFTQDNAEKVLDRLLNNPTEADKRNMAGHSNLRVEEVTEENCWWQWDKS